MFFWLLNATGKSLLIGLFNVTILALEITSNFVNLILPSLLLISATIFPIRQPQRFNKSL